MELVGVAIKRLYQKELEELKNYQKDKINKIKKAVQEIKKFYIRYPFLLWVTRIIVVAMILTISGYAIKSYNKYSSYKATCNEYFAQIGVELKRRNNLIPNLIIAVGKYSVHEQEIFKYVVNAREVFANSKDMTKKIEASKQLDGALTKLLAMVENYPDLKATQSIQDLIKELTNTENRIADWKGKYNNSARMFNGLLTNFPTNILGKIFGIKRQISYISTDEDLLKAPILEFKKDGIEEVKNE